MPSLTVEVPASQFRAWQRRATAERTTVEVLVERALRGLVRKQNDFSPGMSPALARRQRKELERDLAKHHKQTDLAKLGKLRRQITEARKSAKPRRAEAVQLCRVGRQMAKDRGKQLRAEGREAIRQAIEQEKIAAREACDERKAKVRDDMKGEVARARAELKEEKAFQREIKRIDSRAQKKERPRSTAAERRQESDDAVRSNIPEDLQPLFEKVKRSIKGSDRETRTEAFLKYAEENPGEVAAAIEEQAEREIARLQREAAKEERMLRRRGVSAAELAAVPF